MGLHGPPHSYNTVLFLDPAILFFFFFKKKLKTDFASFGGIHGLNTPSLSTSYLLTAFVLIGDRVPKDTRAKSPFCLIPASEEGSRHLFLWVLFSHITDVLSQGSLPGHIDTWVEHVCFPPGGNSPVFSCPLERLKRQAGGVHTALSTAMRLGS